MKSNKHPLYGGELIHTRRDEWGTIEVIDYLEQRCLHFGSTVKQSCKKHHSRTKSGFEYNQKMVLGATFHPDPVDVLVLGLGGGSIASHLHHTMPGLQITAVERREAVIDIALEYFDLPADDRLQLFTAEAEHFVSQIENDWDLILIDLFDAIGVDETALKLNFLDRCHAQLRPSGVLVMNMWRDDEDTYTTTRDYLETCFEERIWYLDEEDGNTIAYAFKEQLPRLTPAITAAARQLGIEEKYLLRQLQQRNHHRIDSH